MNIMWITCANIESAREGSDSDSIADEERCSCEGLDAKDASDRNERLRVWWDESCKQKYYFHLTTMRDIFSLELFRQWSPATSRQLQSFMELNVELPKLAINFLSCSNILLSFLLHDIIISSFLTVLAQRQQKNFHSGDKNIINSLI